MPDHKLFGETTSCQYIKPTTFNTQFPKEKAQLVDVIDNEYSL